MNADIRRPHWSYSAVSQYLKCPLQFYFERVLRLPRRKVTDAQVLGSSIHAALADYHRSLARDQPIPSKHVHQSFLTSWDRQAGDLVVVSDRRSVDDSLSLGIALIDRYLDEPPPTNILGVEVSMLAPITNTGGEVLERPLMVVMDLISRLEDGTPRIVDLKTTSRAYSDSEVATSLQPTCYASALYELTGEEPLVEFVTLVKTRTPKVQRIEAVRTIADFGRLGDLIGVVEQAVAANIFYPVESPLNCSGCPYFRECRSWTGPGNLRSGEFGTSELAINEEAAPCSQS